MATAIVVLEPQVEFTASQVRALKEFFEDFFDTPPAASEAKALGKETGTALQDFMHQLTPLAAQGSQYPFLNALAPVLEKTQIADRQILYLVSDRAHPTGGCPA